MHDLLDPLEAAQARAQGWVLQYVFDVERKTWTLNVMPADFSSPMQAQAYLRQVIERAKSRDALCIKALRLISQFNVKKRK